MLNRQFCPIQVHILEICNDNNKHKTRHIEYKRKKEKIGEIEKLQGNIAIQTLAEVDMTLQKK